MPPRLPTNADFPPNLILNIIPPPNRKRPASVLLLLHGLGDTHAPFANLARQLNLPETACISIQAPTPLPFDLGGFHWGDDIVFDQASGQMDVDTGFERAKRMIAQILVWGCLIEKCGFAARDVVMFGFGQGGMASLAATATISAELGEMGGIVSIGGPLSVDAASKTETSAKCATPALVLHGSSKSLITVSAVQRIRAAFSHVTIHEFKRPGDGMPQNRDEMLPIMQFLARRLRSRAGVPEESHEIG